MLGVEVCDAINCMSIGVKINALLLIVIVHNDMNVDLMHAHIIINSQHPPNDNPRNATECAILLSLT